jgi:hypothetical protein
MHGDERLIRDPEEELAATYRARVRPFVDLGNDAMRRQYEQAWEIARAWLARVRERNESHAS